MLIRFFNLLSRCPLWLLQLGGSALGVGIWLGSPRHRRQLRENAGRVGLSRYQRWLAILHSGRMVAELPRLWLGEPMPFEWSGVDLRPKGIIQMLDLLRPIYERTAAYGHFGRDEPDFTWERTDKAAILKAAAGM